MNKIIASLFAAATLMASTNASASVVLNRDYRELTPPQPASGTQVEVRNFFYYGCPHCFHLHQKMTGWEKSLPGDVDLAHVPTIFNETAEPMARTYFALEAMGERRRLHDAIFRAWHVDHRPMSDKNQIADFVTSQGVDRTKFLAAYDSPAVQGKVNEATQMSQRYAIRGTPTLIVAGRYAITGLPPEETVRVLNEVIDLARNQRPDTTKVVMVAAAPTAAVVTAPASAVPAQGTAAPAQEPAPPKEQAQPPKAKKTKPARPKDLDLRHCLELTEYAAIARCARE